MVSATDIRWDPRNWTEADEDRRGLGLEAVPLWFAGKLGVSLEDSMAIAEFCRGEPTLQTRLDMVQHMIEKDRPRRPGRDNEAELKAATLLYIETSKTPGISTSEAARKVIALRHSGVKEYYTRWKSVANLAQNEELMRLAAVNSRIWPSIQPTVE